MIDSQLLQQFRMNKQNLIEPYDGNDHRDLLYRHIALHSTEYHTPYLSLLARMTDFSPGELFNEISQAGDSVRLKAFRGTIFAVHRKRVGQLIAAGSVFLQRVQKMNIDYAKNSGVHIEKAVQLVTDELSGGALSMAELKKRLDGKLVKDHVPIAIRLLDLKGTIIRAGQRYISSRDVRYMLTGEDILASAKNYDNPDTAVEEIMQDYISIFGPASLEDICWWFPISKTYARNILERINKNISRFDFEKTEYFVTGEDYTRIESFSPPDLSKSIRFLPYEDHFPKAYKVRDWYLSKEVLPLVCHVKKFDAGEIRPTIWVGDRIIGRWEMEWSDKKKSRMNVIIAGISKIPKRTEKLVEKERRKLEDTINERLAGFLRPPGK